MIAQSAIAFVLFALATFRDATQKDPAFQASSPKTFQAGPFVGLAFLFGRLTLASRKSGTSAKAGVQ
jgi:hypothetical protein